MTSPAAAQWRSPSSSDTQHRPPAITWNSVTRLVPGRRTPAVVGPVQRLERPRLGVLGPEEDRPVESETVEEWCFGHVRWCSGHCVRGARRWKLILTHSPPPDAGEQE